MPRGQLRVLVAVAPGVGRTQALAAEGRRRAARGADVVVATVDPHRRPAVADLAGALPHLGDDTHLDLAAALARRPDVVLVDDLERVDPPGTDSDQRWRKVEQLLAAGLDVVATLEIRSVASLAEVVTEATGALPPGRVPDALLLGAEQLELLDMAPQALRRRLAHGGLYPPEQVDATLSRLFTPVVLSTLRELALIWMANALEHRRGQPGQAEARERFLVALSEGPGHERLLHRAARLAARTPGSRLHAVHVLVRRELPGPGESGPDHLRDLAEGVGASYQQVIGDDVATALLDVAAAENTTQLVIGAERSRHPGPRWARFWTPPDTAAQVLAAAPDLGVHVIPLAEAPPERSMPASRRGLSGRRRAVGFALAVTLPSAATIALETAGGRVDLAGDSLVLLLSVVTTALVGGLGPALLSAVIGSTLLNYMFIPPVRTLWVHGQHNIVALVVFLVVAGLVSGVVDRAARLAAQAARATAESRTLAAIASGVLRGQEALPALLEEVRAAFGMTSASLLRPGPEPGGPWQVVGSQGPQPPATPTEADVQIQAGPDLVLALQGRTLAASDRVILHAFAAQAVGLVERDRLASAARVATRLEATERLRDALLAAVGHDLRTPLASATAAVSSLRSQDITWSDAERHELLGTAEESLHRLSRLVSDLLDLSRLRAGALSVATEPMWVEDVVATALDEIGPEAGGIAVRIPDDLPAAVADPALVQRALVNVLTNALRYAPSDRPPLVAVSADTDQVQVRVIDRGPGIPPANLALVFSAFHRLGDTDARTGLGLGLALSRGLIEAMDGTMIPEETPGGGLTMVLSLPRAEEKAVSGQPGRREREDPDA